MEKHRDRIAKSQAYNKLSLSKGKPKNPKVLIEFVGASSCQTKKIISDSKAKVGISSHMCASLLKIGQ
jgi:hypothetical protein